MRIAQIAELLCCGALEVNPLQSNTSRVSGIEIEEATFLNKDTNA
jgi:hypothetical protein